MSNEVWKETFEEQKVTYVLEQQGKVLIIEHVPARVCRETGSDCLRQKPWNACNKLYGSKEGQFE